MLIVKTAGRIRREFFVTGSRPSKASMNALSVGFDGTGSNRIAAQARRIEILPFGKHHIDQRSLPARKVDPENSTSSRRNLPEADHALRTVDEAHTSRRRRGGTAAPSGGTGRSAPAHMRPVCALPCVLKRYGMENARQSGWGNLPRTCVKGDNSVVLSYAVKLLHRPRQFWLRRFATISTEHSTRQPAYQLHLHQHAAERRSADQHGWPRRVDQPHHSCREIRVGLRRFIRPARAAMRQHISPSVGGHATLYRQGRFRVPLGTALLSSALWIRLLNHRPASRYRADHDASCCLVDNGRRFSRVCDLI